MTQTGEHASSSVPGRIWWIPLLLLVLGGALLFPFPMQGRGWNAFFDLAHAPSFFLATLILAILLDPAFALGIPSRPLVALSSRRFLVITVLIALLGAIFEIGQRFVGRSTSIGDAVANSAGAMSAALLVCSRRCSEGVRRIFFALMSAALIFLPLVEPILELEEVATAKKEFPLIASFERARELKGWQSFTAALDRSREWAISGKFSLRIQPVGDRRFSNALMLWPPEDWSDYQSLEFYVRNESSEAVRMQFHVGDLEHTQTGHAPTDRYQREFVLPPQSVVPISIQIADLEHGPSGRLLNKKAVSFLNVVFEKKNDLIVFLDDLKLRRGE